MSTMFNDVSNAMADAVEAIRPGIVSVHGRRRLPASGIIWSEKGVIVTAHHVIERDENLSIVLAGGDVQEARLIGRDPQNDLAVLKIDGETTPVQQGKNEALRVGNFVLALGRPGEQVQATLGTVSALHSGVQIKSERKRWSRRHGGHRAMQVLVDGYIQTDVVMYPGFSGGPLIGGDGMVHGLNTSGFGHSFSVAVPIATIRNTVNILQEHGKMKQGYLGIGVQPVRLPGNVQEQTDQETGLLIVSVESDSPAQQSGLMVGDIIISLDNEATEQLDELLSLLSGGRVGREVPLKLVRGGELRESTIVIKERA